MIALESEDNQDTMMNVVMEKWGVAEDRQHEKCSCIGIFYFWTKIKCPKNGPQEQAILSTTNITYWSWTSTPSNDNKFLRPIPILATQRQQNFIKLFLDKTCCFCSWTLYIK
jgi:hypothetical protein